MKWIIAIALFLTPIPLIYSVTSATGAKDNELTKDEKKDGWILAFDGKTLDGWKAVDARNGKTFPSRRPVIDGTLNPHKSGGYMVYYDKRLGDFVASLDFKLGQPPGDSSCNSGIFLRTASLKARPGKDVGYNGIEVALDSTTTNDYIDAGALYDLSRPLRQMVRDIGEWNRVVITNHENLITVTLNGELVTVCDLDEFPKMHRRPDGSEHKFDVVYKDHPRKGYFGVQDHGCDIYFKNIKLLPLD